MRQAFHLAFRNLWGAGLRTFLNAIVLAFALIIVIFFNGIIEGWNEDARRENIAWEYADGHLYHEHLDIHDPFTYLDGHGLITDAHAGMTPVLIRPITLYPQGRMLSAQLKGIPANQTAIDLPTEYLKSENGNINALIGENMAHTLNVQVGDMLMMRWRDKHGTYDAQTITIAHVFESIVPTVDGGNIWMDIDQVYKLTGLTNEASYFIVKNEEAAVANIEKWNFVSQETLLQPMTDIINAKSSSGIFLYLLFLGIGLLAIFDTQVLSIFRRQKEIGTYIALGMTRWQVVRIFTFEGIMYSIFGVILAALIGTPLLVYMTQVGYYIPMQSSDIGVPMSDIIYPVYSIKLILSTTIILITFATLVSFIPARKIAKINPILALKGKAM